VALLLGCGGKPKDPGEQAYQNVCAYCHHMDGTGTRTGPALVGPWLHKEALARIIIHGMEGPVQVGKEMYAKPMAGLGGRMTDDEIAAAMTYVQQKWGKGGAAVTAAEVKKIRDATKDRTTAWTAPELEALMR
jgi:mono/diheme cytochrome c family protein